MGILKLAVTVYECERCEHSWIPRGAITGEEAMPTVCPKCKSPYWNRPRRVNAIESAGAPSIDAEVAAAGDRITRQRRAEEILDGLPLEQKRAVLLEVLAGVEKASGC